MLNENWHFFICFFPYIRPLPGGLFLSSPLFNEVTGCFVTDLPTWVYYSFWMLVLHMKYCFNIFSKLADYFWLCAQGLLLESMDYTGCQKLYPGWSRAREAFHLLYFDSWEDILSDPHFLLYHWGFWLHRSYFIVFAVVILASGINSLFFKECVRILSLPLFLYVFFRL